MYDKGLSAFRVYIKYLHVHDFKHTQYMQIKLGIHRPISVKCIVKVHISTLRLWLAYIHEQRYCNAKFM